MATVRSKKSRKGDFNVSILKNAGVDGVDGVDRVGWGDARSGKDYRSWLNRSASNLARVPSSSVKPIMLLPP